MGELFLVQRDDLSLAQKGEADEYTWMKEKVG